MYGFLWRILPGPWWLKLFLYLLVIAAILWAVVTFVFPWVQATYFAPIDVTVHG